ncbi:MAG: hypothetical protein K5883_06325 [Pseudobutyrivibrio sp.]|nr:hypothetical protein [Pseudobutyrivibrio sp.]
MKKIDLDTVLGHLIVVNIILSILLYILMTKVPVGLEPREIIYHGLFGLVLLLWFIFMIFLCIHVVESIKFSEIKNAKIKRNSMIIITIIVCLNIIFAYLLFVAGPENRMSRGREIKNDDGTITVRFISILHPDRAYDSLYKSKYLIYRYEISDEDSIIYLD